MSSLFDAYKIAYNEIGTKEYILGDNNPRIIEYHATTTLHAKDDETSWCSSFVNWCIIKAGLKGTNSAAARSWLTWGVETQSPKLGDIVVLKRGDDPRFGHVGFFALFENEFVYVLSGNQANSVCIMKFWKKNIISFRTLN